MSGRRAPGSGGVKKTPASPEGVKQAKQAPGEPTKQVLSKPEVKSGNVLLLSQSIRNIVSKNSTITVTKSKCDELALAISAAISAESATEGRGGGLPPMKLLQKVLAMLPTSPGDFPDDPIACRLVRGTISASELFEGDNSADKDIDPRNICRRKLVSILLKYPSFANDREKSLDVATRIERSCFNEVVAFCKNGSSLCRRDWNSPQFVGLYSDRVGTVINHINPTGIVCRNYGTDILDRLISEASFPDDIGRMTAMQMCPQATQRERLEIECRSNQKVIKKWSELFKCPSCKTYKCTYDVSQKRSLDEPPTVKCTCVCNFVWVVS